MASEAIDESLNKLEYYSLVSKVCTELKSHVRCRSDCRSETVDEFDAKLKENCAEMPDYFVCSLLTIIHAILPPKSKSDKTTVADGKKTTAFPALAIADDRDQARDLGREIEKEAKQKDRDDQDRDEERDRDCDRERERGRDRHQDRDCGRDRDRDRDQDHDGDRRSDRYRY